MCNIKNGQSVLSVFEEGYDRLHILPLVELVLPWLTALWVESLSKDILIQPIRFYNSSISIALLQKAVTQIHIKIALFFVLLVMLVPIAFLAV